VRERLIRNLHQKPNGDYPFLFLDPSLAWSGGFKWWYRRLRPLLVELINLRKAKSMTEAMHFLAKRIAAVELSPYHSTDGSPLKGISREPRMPSVVQAREFLARSSNKPEQLTVVLRGHEKWKHPGCAHPKKYDHHHHGPKQQTISLDPNVETGRKILEWLVR
jgi:hypothetical protein